MTILAIDFETANETRHSPCSIGFAFIEDGRVVERATRLIRPREMRFSPGNIQVHGLRPGDVAHAPEFPEVMAEFLPRLAGGLVMAHHAAFDVGVLGATMALYGMAQPPFSSLCTVAVARAAWPGLERYRLSALAARLDIRFRHHDAGEDAHACALIALAAARDAGFPDIAAMGERLALTRRRAAAPGRPAPYADSVAARACRAAHREVAPLGLRFAVRGSRGDRYEITLDEGAAAPACSCAAGRFRRTCRHVSALLCGDVTDLISGDPCDVARLGRRLAV